MNDFLILLVVSPTHKETEHITVYRESVLQTVIERHSQEVTQPTFESVVVTMTHPFPLAQKALA